MPTKKFRLVNLNPVGHYNTALPFFRSNRPAYYTRHNDLEIDRSAVVVAHRQKGRIVSAHTLAELCGFCEEINQRQKQTSKGNKQ